MTVVVCDVLTDAGMPAPLSGLPTQEPTFYGAAAVRFTEGLESA